jgi:5'-nucleotidase
MQRLARPGKVECPLFLAPEPPADAARRLVAAAAGEHYHGVYDARRDPSLNSPPLARRRPVQILLTNDDGIYAPGLTALERALAELGDVCVVAPVTEQSGVGHSITFLSPLVVKELYDRERRRGWGVEGSPADCVKIGLFELCPRRPALVVSGINGGLNAGINVLYSGTVAAAIEGAFFGITSIAVSLEYNEHARFDDAARLAVSVIRQVLDAKGPEPVLYNLNIPTAALHQTTEVRIVPMGVERYGEHYEKRIDPRGRSYYWATSEPPPPPGPEETDLTALARGYVTLTPLDYDLTRRKTLAEMRSWNLNLPALK